MTDDDRARLRAIRERQGCDTPMYMPGWDHILDALAEAVDMQERHVGKVGAWRATHVKEKFGVLRISSTGGDAHTRALEHFALLVSARTCQRCGAPGEARKFGSSEPFWHATLCEACSAAERAARLGLAPTSRH